MIDASPVLIQKLLIYTNKYNKNKKKRLPFTYLDRLSWSKCPLVILGENGGKRRSLGSTRVQKTSQNLQVIHENAQYTLIV